MRGEAKEEAKFNPIMITCNDFPSFSLRFARRSTRNSG